MTDLSEFDDEWAGPTEWARLYRACGLQVVPAYNPGEPPDDRSFKQPKIKWKEFEDTLVPDASFDRWYGPTGEFRARYNMGLITGRASGNILCVDLDVNEGCTAMEWWAGVLAVHNHNMEPETVSQRTGGGGRQILFRAPEGYRAPTNKTGIGVDLRGQGGFMMCPPSMHQSGKRYEWEEGRAPHETEIADAPEWLLEEIHDLVLKHGGTKGGHRERAESVEETNQFGLIVNGREEALQRMVWARVVDLRREGPIPPSKTIQEENLRELWTSYLSRYGSRLPAREGASKADLLEMEGRGWSELERKWRYAVKKWDKEVKAAALVEKEPPTFVEAVGETAVQVVTTETVVEPKQVGQPAFDPWERYPVPDFPLDVLPPHLQRFVEYQAKSTGGDISACAMAALAVCSGALDQNFSLKMKRSGDWSARPRLWVMLVGDPSSKKSPIIAGCIKPLRAHEKVGNDAHRKAMARWKADGSTKGEEPERGPRYIFNDITTEKLGDILSRQDRGALVEVDEISGWIGSMDKYSGGKGSAADRGFWIQAYNGGPRTIDRLSRGEIYVDNLCVAFLGGIQPDRLSELGNLTSDGLLQRFLPVMMKRASYSDEVEHDGPAKHYETLITELVRAKPSSLRMDEGALVAMGEFQRFVHDIETMDALGKSFCTFAGKLTGVCGTLALLLHMVEDPENSAVEQVSERVVRNAIRLIQSFIIPHATELYRATTDSADWSSLRQIASFVLTSDKDRFTASDFTVGVRSLRGSTLYDVSQAVSPLVAGGWLNEDPTHKPARAWTVVQGLKEALSERRESETRRKAEALEIIKVSIETKRTEK